MKLGSARGRTLATKGASTYEIWNEVDLDCFWTGSLSPQMLQMVQVQISLLSRPIRLRSFVTFAAGGDKFSDAVPCHLYDTQVRPEDSVTDVYEVTLAIARQFGKEIWDTEVGRGPFGTFPTQQDEAAFTARTRIPQAAEGINVIVWFAWNDRGPWVHIFFVGPDFQTPTPAATAFSVECRRKHDLLDTRYLAGKNRERSCGKYAFYFGIIGPN